MLTTLIIACLSWLHSGGPPPVFQPKTYASPSGEWELFVDPTNRLGKGAGRYRLSRRGEVAWAGERGYTLRDVVVDDCGISAGYAASIDASGKTGGTVVVAIFSASGENVLEQVVERANTSSASPNPRGLCLQSELDRFFVRMLVDGAGTTEDEWWSYRLSTGDLLSRIRPAALLENGEKVKRCNAARSVAGTPLTIVQWEFDDWSTWPRRERGARFVVCDADWRSVWSLDLPQDYTGLDDRGNDALNKSLWAGTFVREAKVPRTFELVRYSDQQVITYAVDEVPGSTSGWSVRELRRGPYEAPVDAEIAMPPRIDLPRLASVPLGGGVSATMGPIRDIQAFELLADGGVQFVRKERKGAGQFSLVNVDMRGEFLAEVSIAPIELGEAKVGWWPLGQGLWLVTSSPFGVYAWAKAWRLDANTGSALALSAFECPAVDRIVATRDGGFVALATYIEKNTTSDTLVRFDADGHKLWELRQAQGYDRNDPSAFLSPEDLAVTRDGVMVVVDNIRNTLQTFRDDGEFIALIDLERAWGKEPRYPCDIYATPDGGVLVHDFMGQPAWWRMSVDGAVAAKFDLSRDDANDEFGSPSTMRVDADGRLWSTDGRVFMRFDLEGHREFELGRQADPHEIQEAADVFIDSLGRVVIIEGRTQSLHFFDAEGQATLVCIPHPGDLAPRRRIERVSIDGEGHVGLKLSAAGQRVLLFDRDGVRKDNRSFGVDLFEFRPNGSEYWGSFQKPYDVLEMRHHAADGSLIRTLARRPDGMWLRDIEQIGVGADGSLVVLDAPQSRAIDSGKVLAVYGPDGEPQRTIPLPNDVAVGWKRPIALGHRWIVLATSKPGAFVVSRPTGSAHHFVASEIDGESRWTVALSPDESELWLAQANPPTLHRYALPEK